MCEIFRDHGTVEGHEADCVRDVRQQTSDIAVANENLGVVFDVFEIESFKKIIGAVSAAGADNGTDVISREHFVEFARPPISRSGKIKILLKDGIKIKRFVSHST